MIGVRVMRVLLTRSLPRTLDADPVYTIENQYRAGNERRQNSPDKITLNGFKHRIFAGQRI